MGKEPRQHHFLPESYLSGFTDSGDRDGFLHMIGVSDGRLWKGKPSTVGSQRDFYRLDGVAGIDASIVEKTFAEFEGGRLASVMQSIIGYEQLPDKDDDFSYLITFVALMSARVPRTRETFSRPVREMAKKLMQARVSSEERWRSTVARVRASGVELSNVADDYLAMRDALEGDGVEFEASKSYQLKQLLDIQHLLVQLLGLRHWTLILAQDSAQFVTSDNPVALVWTTPQAGNVLGPGFGLRGTDVTFPLTTRLALIGRFEGPSETLLADRRTIANINQRTIRFAQRFVASPSADVVWLTSKNEVAGTHELRAFLAQNAVTDSN